MGKLELVTVHTGQHYDKNMSQVFFDQLGMKKPDYKLDLGGGSHGEQTGKMLIEIEKVIFSEEPDAVLIYGDTNSTLAGSLAASKLHIPCIHVEAGLRSYNKKMPEEINRVMTDHVSDLLLVPSEMAVRNLEKEGITDGVHVVGDIMKDLVLYCQKNSLLINPEIDGDYIYVTLHRPYNVDDPSRLINIINQLNHLNYKVIFPAHPRTKNQLVKHYPQIFKSSNLQIIDSQPYFENLGYLAHSTALITDSGGMQKEAYWLNKKCITIRTETEWKETLDGGSNSLVFDNLNEIEDKLSIDNSKWNPDLYGDGQAGVKIVDQILSLI